MTNREPIQDDIERGNIYDLKELHDENRRLVAERQVCEAEHWDRVAVDGLVAEATQNLRFANDTARMLLAERDRLLAENTRLNDVYVSELVVVKAERDSLVAYLGETADAIENHNVRREEVAALLRKTASRFALATPAETKGR